ncbi:MAG: Gfo/Idh/MocA family oxidoreductase [Treponema sp.]|nr:Gfo/Idh/MocA family oxidoreductase [Treponema sp.]
MLNVGIISTWHVHTRDYVAQLKNHGKVNICALWDEDPQKGRDIAAEWKVDFEENFEAFINRKDFSAVICNAPTTMHFDLLLKSAEAGKHIFTEKLLTVTTQDAEQLAEKIRRAGIIFTISLPLRCNAAILYIKELVDSGTLGRISGARFRRSHGGVSDAWLPEYWFDTSMTGGGAMMDLGAHPVYILSFLFGPPVRVTGLLTQPFGSSSDENAIGLAEFKDGILGTMETAFLTYGVPDLLEVYGTEGSVFMEGPDLRVRTKSLDALSFNDARPKALPAGRPSPVIQFAEACLNKTGSPEYLGIDDAVLMTRTIEAIYQSDKTGQTLRF